MPTEDKKVKLSFTVDTQSLAIAKRAIADITSAVSKLAEQLSRVNLSGAGGGSLLGGITARAGAINTQQPQNSRINTGIGGGITGGLSKDAESLASLAKAATAGLRDMTTAVRSSTQSQVGELERLRKAVKDLGFEYDNLARKGTPGDPRQAAAHDFPSSMEAGRGGGFGPMTSTRGGVDYVGEPPPSSSGGWGGRIAKMMPNMFNISSGVAAVTAPYVSGMYMFNQRQAFQASEALAAPMDSLNRRASISQSYGNLGMDLRRDLVTGYAASTLTASEVRAALGPETFRSLVTQAALKSKQTGTISKIMDRVGKGMDIALGTPIEGVGMVAGITEQAKASYRGAQGVFSNQGDADIALYERYKGNIPQEMAAMLPEVVKKKLEAMNVRDRTYMAEFQQEIPGRLSLMRMARMGDKAQLLGVGTAFNEQEIAGMRSRLGAVAGGGFMGAAGSMLSMQAGGLGNAAEIFGGAAQFGQGNAFMRTLSRASSGYGRAGLVDASASGQVGQMLTGMMMGSAYDTTGGGIGALNAVMSTTGLLGGNLRAAGNVMGGMQDLTAYQGGQTDKFQEAINVLASTRAAPGLGHYAQAAIRDINPATRLDILAGRTPIPMELSARGITRDMISSYQSEVGSRMLANYVDTGQGSDVSRAVSGVRSQGMAGYLGGQLGGATPGSQEGRGILRQQLRLIGIALHDSGRAKTEARGAAMAALELGGSSPEMLSALTTGGLGDPAGRSFAAEIKKAKDKEIRDKEDALSGPLKDKIRTGSGDAPTVLANSFDNLSTKLNVGPASVIKALEDFRLALDKTAKRLKAGPPR